MSNSNGIITPPVINPGDTKKFISAAHNDIGGQILDGVAGKVRKWSKIKPIPFKNDYAGNTLMGARIGQTVDGVVGGNKYNLKNDVTGGSKSMYGYVGEVINDTTNKTLTVCGLKLKYFAATAGETTGLKQCCDAMDSVAAGDSGSSAYNWPYEWKESWYRFTDFENYYKNAQFPFGFFCQPEVNQGSSFEVQISNKNVGHTYELSPSDFADGLVNWKFGVILKATPVNAQASVQYVLFTGESVGSDTSTVTISETYTNLSAYSKIQVYCVMTGNIANSPYVIPMPFGTGLNETPAFTVDVKSQASSDVLQYFDIKFDGFGYNIGTRTKVISMTEMATQTSPGKVPATNDKLLLKVTLKNLDNTSHILPVESLAFDAYRDWIRTGRFTISNGMDVYNSSGTKIVDDGSTATTNPAHINVAANASLVLFFEFGNIWGTSLPSGGNEVLFIQPFHMLWLDTHYEGGSRIYVNSSLSVNSPSSSADSGKVGVTTMDYSMGTHTVTSYTSY